MYGLLTILSCCHLLFGSADEAENYALLARPLKLSAIVVSIKSKRLEPELILPPCPATLRWTLFTLHRGGRRVQVRSNSQAPYLIPTPIQLDEMERTEYVFRFDRLLPNLRAGRYVLSISYNSRGVIDPHATEQLVLFGPTPPLEFELLVDRSGHCRGLTPL